MFLSTELRSRNIYIIFLVVWLMIGVQFHAF